MIASFGKLQELDISGWETGDDPGGIAALLPAGDKGCTTLKQLLNGESSAVPWPGPLRCGASTWTHRGSYDVGAVCCSQVVLAPGPAELVQLESPLTEPHRHPGHR
jgi:hypothetical protein